VKRLGLARRRMIASLVPDDAEWVVDVGADHGHVAKMVGAVATERMPNRSGRDDVPWVICDGVAAFRRVPCAIIAGMGAHTIAGILDRGPLPDTLIVHTPDDPPALREALAERGYRIDAEGLAWEARRYAEVIRARRGQETATGLRLAFGPVLVEGDSPHLAKHLQITRDYYGKIAKSIGTSDPDRAKWMRDRAEYLHDVMVRRGFASEPL